MPVLSFFHQRSQCINQMKELKEQCEEQIEEVTKKGNEAVASRDLNGKKEQSQQVILGFSAREFQKAPCYVTGCLVCCVLCSR